MLLIYNFLDSNRYLLKTDKSGSVTSCSTSIASCVLPMWLPESFCSSFVGSSLSSSTFSLVLLWVTSLVESVSLCSFDFTSRSKQNKINLNNKVFSFSPMIAVLSVSFFCTHFSFSKLSVCAASSFTMLPSMLSLLLIVSLLLFLITSLVELILPFLFISSLSP